MSGVRNLVVGLVVASVLACGSTEGAPPLDAGSHPSGQVDPDKDADPSAPSPPEPALETPLIERFAPHVHLNPEDWNRPANVDWYLARVSMRFHHDNCNDHEIVPLGKLTQALLVEQAHPDNRSLCRHDDGKETSSTTSDRFFLEIAEPSTTYPGAPREEWKTYVVSRPSETPSLVDIEYWFFYAFNENVAMFDHESDWEHVRVTVDPKAEGGKGAAVEVKMSAHHGGTIMRVGDARLTMEGGTHPVTYSSKGTHANYPQPGTYDIEGTGGAAQDVAKEAPTADVWKTETALLPIGTRDAPKNGQLFVKFWGRWGEIRDLPETNGVTRHFP
ncbi:MAG TPA: Vps62-related protein [Labilithrix sp.]|jgi:hypothetical protein|nr:Vps62-related protein [Labilithrix sp.]